MPHVFPSERMDPQCAQVAAAQFLTLAKDHGFIYNTYLCVSV